MAAASPIILNSSSPNALPVSPPSGTQRQQSTIHGSSSPGLPSPSTFLKAKQSALKSGSRAQEAPDGVKIGFASAGSLWKLNDLERERRHDESRASEDAAAEKGEKTKKSSGKLVKPKKTEQKPTEAVSGRAEHELDEYAYLEGDETKQQTNAKPKLKSSRTTTKATAVERSDVPQSPASAKSPSINLVDYALADPIAKEGSKDVLEKAVEKPKKSRKRPAKADDVSGDAPPKKARKPKKKSESIILNSDEPDLQDDPVTTSNYFAQERLRCIAMNDKQSKWEEKTRQSAEIEACEPKDVGPTNAVDTKLNKQSLRQGQAPSTAEEQSNYFFKPSDEHGQVTTTATVISAEARGEQGPSMIESVSPYAAPSRRRDWTPVKDSVRPYADDQHPNTTDSKVSDEGSVQPRRQLSVILGTFGYVANEAQPLERSPTGEGLTKRIRLEPGPSVGVGAKAQRGRKAKAQSAPKAQKPKKGRKKPRTITALATAAFQPPAEEKADEGTVSPLFSPQKDRDNVESPASVEQPKPKATKPRKPRKPKEPKTDAAASKTTAKPKKAAAPKKTKVKFNEADYLPKLYSPERATKHLKNQDLLFGTSSQLAVDEPASFIHDMQTALQQSELAVRTRTDGAPASSQVAFSQTQRSPKGKSCIRVPTAPHGTCLSIEQAGRELWCVSARDSEGVVFRNEKPVEPTMEIEQHGERPLALPAVPGAEASAAKESEPASRKIIVDLCDTPTVAAPQETAVDDVNDAHLEELPINPSPVTHAPRALMSEEAPVAEETPEDDEDWMFIRSSSPAPIETNRSRPAASVAQPILNSSPRMGDLKVLSPKRFRPPLNPLDPNKGFTTFSPSKQSTSMQVRAISTTAANRSPRAKSPTGRPRGRPRKEKALETSNPSLPKKRGRPPKLKPLASDSAALIPTPKKPKTTAASQPVVEDDFIDIDDIYDSDAAKTPTPPRKRARLSPPAVQPLTLSPSGSPSGSPAIRAKAPAVAAAATLKAKDETWLSLRADVFARITAVVKSAPRSEDASKPTWWEKILLYDPIVLEDLTAWLNGRGLRVEVRKLKAKAKKKGRRKKDEGMEEGDGDGEAEGWEVLEEPLQAWMVQKWCEEKSICCLWRDGLRGGVRSRY